MELLTNDWFRLGLILLAIYLAYKVGHKRGQNIQFGFGSSEKPYYSFSSGKTLADTIKNIKTVVLENAELKEKLKSKNKKDSHDY